MVGPIQGSVCRKAPTPLSGAAAMLPQAWRLSKPPMLVMAAERDALFPLAQTRMGFAAMGCEVETLAGTGHAVMLDRGWQRAADRVIEWLGALAS